PLSRGGETQPGNVVPACTSCNSSKKDRSPLEWHPPRIDSAALFEAIALAAEAGWL
ncbi:MAG TPA: HNH endonuclease, partial [Patescibacteria group bacterium]|nr:HNH endonuclease [Patescibacteria group bacterium]